MTEAENSTTEEHAQETYVLPEEFVREAMAALEEGRSEAMRAEVLALSRENLAELFNQLSGPHRQQLVRLLGEQFDDNVLPYLEPDTTDDVIEALGTKKTAEALAELETDDAIHVIEELSQAEQQEILEKVEESVREEIEEGLSYPEESAGRLMRKAFVAVPEYWNIGDTIDYLRSGKDVPEDFYVIYVVDPKFHPVGKVRLGKLMQHHRSVGVRDIIEEELHQQPVATDQEEVAYVFRKFGLVEAPVVNEEGRLVGTITVDDVVDVIQEEEEEDFMRSGGLREQDMYAGLFKTVSKRFPWLFINLITAVIASMVIDYFQDAIAALVLLAVLMPIIASMGGNAGIQAATVAVRAIAMRRLSPGGAAVLIRKEILLGLLNGLGIALVTVIGIYVLYQDMEIALIFGAAMIFTMMMAGLCGAGLPLLLQKLGADPAISSGVFLTMFTDIVGFLSFLGLAAWMLGNAPQ